MNNDKTHEEVSGLGYVQDTKDPSIYYDQNGRKEVSVDGNYYRIGSGPWIRVY